MSWAENMLDASWRGVPFDCVSTSERRARVTVAHEYPHVDGADIEDQGLGARELSLRVVFNGSDYDTRLTAFIAALGAPGKGELIHPIWGSIPDAVFQDYDISHEADNVDYCSVELHFIESVTSAPAFFETLPIQQAAVLEQHSEAARAAGIDAFASALDALQGVQSNIGRLNALRQIMTGSLTIIKSQVSGIITTTLDVVNYPRGFAGDVAGLMRGMFDLRAFDVGTLLGDWKSLANDLAAVVQLPGQVSAGSQDQQLGDSSPTLSAAPADVALVTNLFQVAAVAQLVEAAGLVLAAEADAPSLSPVDIEDIANSTRESIQAAIEQSLALYEIEQYRPLTEALRDAALAVQAAAMTIIELRPPLIQRAVAADSNLHLIAHNWYADYTRAAELLRLNPAIRNPNAIRAGEVLNAYAR